VNESDWLVSEDPAAMLGAVTPWPDFPSGPRVGEQVRPPTVTTRKLRLFACACCRLIWPLLTDSRSRRAVEVAERYADGEPNYFELAREISETASIHVEAMRGSILEEEIAAAVNRCVTDGCFSSGRLLVCYACPPAAQAAILRDLAGNPWRPVTLPWVERTVNVPESAVKRNPFAAAAARAGALKRTIRTCPWRTPTVIALASAAYAESRQVTCSKCEGIGCPYCGGSEMGYHTGCFDCPVCNGTGRFSDGLLDPDRLAVLADALEDAGCENADVLGHLRSPGPHARGCWALDLILGKD
jgi:hypothetical protein